MATFSAAIGYTGDVFPHTMQLANGHAITLLDENGGYLADMGHGVSNPWIGLAPHQQGFTASQAQALVAQRFCGGQPKKGEVREMQARLFTAA